MCTYGDVTLDIDIESQGLDVNEYVCLDCQNIFKGLGDSVVCPECQSDKVELKK